MINRGETQVRSSFVLRGPFGSISPLLTRPKAVRRFRPTSTGSNDGPVFGLASDVAANLFVVLFLAFAVAISASQPLRTAETFDLAPMSGVVERAPSSSAALVAALYRRQAVTSTLIDLLPDRLRLTRDGHVQEWRWEIAGESFQTLTDAATSIAPIDLFVFDPRGYAFVLKALQDHALQETNVPAALRSCLGEDRDAAGCADGRDWSSGFQRLIGLRLTQDEFRSALAQLLAARSDAPASRVAGGAHRQRDASGMPARSSTDRTANAIGSLALFVGVLGVVELIARIRIRQE